MGGIVAFGIAAAVTSMPVAESREVRTVETELQSSRFWPELDDITKVLCERYTEDALIDLFLQICPLLRVRGLRLAPISLGLQPIQIEFTFGPITDPEPIVWFDEWSFLRV